MVSGKFAKTLKSLKLFLTMIVDVMLNILSSLSVCVCVCASVLMRVSSPSIPVKIALIFYWCERYVIVCCVISKMK